MRPLILTLYQHTFKSREMEPDGAPYGTQAEAEAAAARAAHEEVEGFDGDDLAEAICQHTDADELTDERIEAIRGGAELTDEEARMAAEELRGFESAIYSVSVEVPAEQVLSLLDAIGHEHAEAALLAIRTQADVSPATLLETGVVLARQVVERWESGDLASAVNGLETWADDVVNALPGLDYAPDEEEDA